jgi:hypothetical protein
MQRTLETSEGAEMKHAARNSQPRPSPKLHGRPSTPLGWAAAAAMAGSITLVILVNAVGAQGTEGESAWQRVLFIGINLSLVASWVVALVAVFRRHERSWVVLLPAALLTVVVVNELVQGVLQLLGLGGD